MDLSDNMKALEYFRFMINEKNVSPEEAFIEAIDFVTINSDIAKESYSKGKKDGEVAGLRAMSKVLEEIADTIVNDGIEFLVEVEHVNESEEEDCNCDYCQGIQRILDEYGIEKEDLINTPLDSEIWDRIEEFNERYEEDEH